MRWLLLLLPLFLVGCLSDDEPGNAMFTPHEGDTWVYRYYYDGGGASQHITGNKTIRLNRIVDGGDDFRYTFTERDSLWQRDRSEAPPGRPVDTTFSYGCEGCLQGDAFDGRVLPWTDRGGNTRPFSSYLYRENVGLVYYTCCSAAVNSKITETYSIRSFNGRPINGDSIAHVPEEY